MTWARKGHTQPNDPDWEECWACLWEGWGRNSMHRALPGQGLSQGCFGQRRAA